MFVPVRSIQLAYTTDQNMQYSISARHNRVIRKMTTILSKVLCTRVGLDDEVVILVDPFKLLSAEPRLFVVSLVDQTTFLLKSQISI